MGKGTIVIVLILLVLISSGCITNTKELAKIDELITQLQEKDTKIIDLSTKIETKNKKISAVEEKSSELSSQIITKNEELAKQSNELREKNDDILGLVDSKTKLEERINQLTLNLSKEQKINTDTVDFLKDYSITLVHIHRAISYLGLSNLNLQAGDDYVYSGEYNYVDAERIYDKGKEYALDSKELLIKAKRKLREIEDKAPNSFFKQEIKNRVDHINELLSNADILYSMIDYAERSTYEINYGTESKSIEYDKNYNDLIPKYNSNLKKLSDIENIIDLEWDQDWYSTFKEEAGSSETSYL